MDNVKLAKKKLVLAKDLVAGVGIYIDGYENKTILSLTSDIHNDVPRNVGMKVNVDIDGATDFRGHTGVINVYPRDGAEDITVFKKYFEKVLNDMKKQGFDGKVYVNKSKMTGNDIIRIDITKSPYEGMEELSTSFTYTTMSQIMLSVGFIKEEELSEHYGGEFKVDDFLKAFKSGEVQRQLRGRGVQRQADTIKYFCERAKELGHDTIHYA